MNTLAKTVGPEGGENDKDDIYTCRREMMEHVGVARTKGVTREGAAWVGAAWTGDVGMGPARAEAVWMGARPWRQPIPLLRVLKH